MVMSLEKIKSLIRTGDTGDSYTRNYIQNEVIPWLKRELFDLRGTNEACREKGLGAMMDEDIEEMQGWLELAEKRWNG